MHTHKPSCYLLLFLCSSIHKQKIFHVYSFSLEIFLIQLLTLITSSHLSFPLSQISWFTSVLFQNLLMKYLIIFLWLISNSYKIIPPCDLGLFQFLETETSSLFSNLWSSFLSIPSAETTGICHHAWIQHCSHPCVELRQVRNTNYDNIILNMQGIFLLNSVHFIYKTKRFSVNLVWALWASGSGISSILDPVKCPLGVLSLFAIASVAPMPRPCLKVSLNLWMVNTSHPILSDLCWESTQDPAVREASVLGHTFWLGSFWHPHQPTLWIFQ